MTDCQPVERDGRYVCPVCDPLGARPMAKFGHRRCRCRGPATATSPQIPRLRSEDDLAIVKTACAACPPDWTDATDTAPAKPMCPRRYGVPDDRQECLRRRVAQYTANLLNPRFHCPRWPGT
jgi:hypothetical protein